MTGYQEKRRASTVINQVTPDTRSAIHARLVAERPAVSIEERRERDAFERAVLDELAGVGSTLAGAARWADRWRAGLIPRVEPVVEARGDGWHRAHRRQGMSS